MPRRDDLINLERAAWTALATSGEAAGAFYERTLADDVLLLLPGGIVIDDRAQVIESMSGAPWLSFELENERVLELGDACAAVAYQAVAVRDSHEYRALFNSTYVLEGGAWKLALHQQTPI